MIEIRRLPEFDEWLNDIKDMTTKLRLVARLKKVSMGNFGDVKPLTDGEGVYEMREFFGAGYRMYYVQHGNMIVVMLGGGTKDTQTRDIKKAITLAKTIEFEKGTDDESE